MGKVCFEKRDPSLLAIQNLCQDSNFNCQGKSIKKFFRRVAPPSREEIPEKYRDHLDCFSEQAWDRSGMELLKGRFGVHFSKGSFYFINASQSELLKNTIEKTRGLPLAQKLFQKNASCWSRTRYQNFLFLKLNALGHPDYQVLIPNLSRVGIYLYCGSQEQPILPFSEGVYRVLDQMPQTIQDLKDSVLPVRKLVSLNDGINVWSPHANAQIVSPGGLVLTAAHVVLDTYDRVQSNVVIYDPVTKKGITIKKEHILVAEQGMVLLRIPELSNRPYIQLATKNDPIPKQTFKLSYPPAVLALDALPQVEAAFRRNPMKNPLHRLPLEGGWTLFGSVGYPILLSRDHKKRMVDTLNHSPEDWSSYQVPVAIQYAPTNFQDIILTSNPTLMSESGGGLYNNQGELFAIVQTWEVFNEKAVSNTGATTLKGDFGQKVRDIIRKDIELKSKQSQN